MSDKNKKTSKDEDNKDPVTMLIENGEQYLFDIQRPVIVNGISDIVTQPDLPERSIIIDCNNDDLPDWIKK